MREFFTYRIRDRKNEPSTILPSRRLFQQVLVDGFTMVESSRSTYFRTHQKELGADIYKGLSEAILGGETNPSSRGKCVTLRSSFTEGARYMIQNYQDAMSIYKWACYPDLFITFTCNPRCPKILRVLQNKHLKPEDRLDIVCRVFKIKLDQMINDLKHGKVFGRVKACCV